MVLRPVPICGSEDGARRKRGDYEESSDVTTQLVEISEAWL